MGMAPGILPGRTTLANPSAGLRGTWKVVPQKKGRDTLAQLVALADGSQKALLSLGADLATNIADAALVERALSA